MSANSSLAFNNGYSSKTAAIPLSKKFVAEFKTFFSKMIDESASKISYFKSWNLRDRIKTISEYYTFEKKPMFGEIMIHAYELLEDPGNHSDEKHRQSYILACLLELGVSYVLFMDDIHDNAKIRYNKICWHLLPEVGCLAMNDATILRSFIEVLIRQHFVEPLCSKILEIFNEIYFKSDIGQHIDVMLARDRNYDKFTSENYNIMTQLKTAFSVIESPIILALLLSNKASEESKQQIHNLCKDIGILFQIQNDVDDLYNSDETKTAVDIQTGKCSWLAIAALERSNDQQRRVFKSFYGSWNPSDVQKIKDLYEELQLQQRFAQEREARLQKFLRKVNELPPDAVPGKSFYNELYKLIKKYVV